ncbi:MAG: biopolymer transporter ExbD [Alphaproteobacteria bacterium]|nr:MAG: biopolymer transporter ExbD [Alphaproteobacteria bacterium]
MAYQVEIERNRKKPRTVGLVPMINVILLMLIFFVLAGKIEPVDIIPVNIPLSEQSSHTSLGEEIITLGRHDEIVAGNDVMFNLDDLHRWVHERIKKNPAARFTIKADADMEAYKLIDMMKYIEDAGAQDVVLAAQKP